MSKPIFLLLFAVFLISQSLFIYRERQVAGEWGLALDDSWIHMVFARNLSAKEGYSFNPGQPVSGSTSPLWTLLLAVFFTVTGPSVWTAKILGMALFLLSILLTYKLARFIWSDERIATFSAILVALSPFLNWGALSGMEVSLYVALSLWGIYLHLVNSEKRGLKKYSSTLVLTLAGLARPECFLILFIAWGDEFLLTRIRRKHERLGKVLLEFLPHLLIFAALTLPYFVFNLVTVNSLFPSSFAAKTGSGGVLGELFQGNLRGAIVAATIKPLYMVIVALGTLLSDNPILSLGFLLGIIALAGMPARGMRRGPWLVPSFLLLIPLGMGLFGHVKALGQSNRYAAHLFPLFIIIATGGVFSIPRVVREDRNLNRKVKGGLYLLAALFIAIYLLLALTRQHLFRLIEQIAPHTGLTHLCLTDVQGYFAQIDLFLKFSLLSLILPILLLSIPKEKDKYRRQARFLSYVLIVLSVLLTTRSDIVYADYYAYNVKNINDLHVATGKWLNENTPKEAVIAINDIGGIGYFAHREIIDLIGMATPEIIPYRQRGESGIIDYFKTVKRPDYLVIYPEWFPLIDSMKEDFKRIKEFRIQHNTVCIHDRHVVYEVKLTNERPGALPEG
jgi:hypothetical protein